MSGEGNLFTLAQLVQRMSNPYTHTRWAAAEGILVVGGKGNRQVALFLLLLCTPCLLFLPRPPSSPVGPTLALFITWARKKSESRSVCGAPAYLRKLLTPNLMHGVP